MILLEINHHLYNKLIEITSKENVLANEELRNHTYTKLGGNADFYVTPENYKEVQDIVKLANSENTTFTLLGNGSNLIVKDGGIRGIVLNLQKLNEIKTEENVVVAQSGARIIDVSRHALKRS